MSLGRKLKKLVGKKKSRGRRDAGLGGPQDPLTAMAPTEALVDPLQAPARTMPTRPPPLAPTRMPTRPPPSAPATWGSASPSTSPGPRRKLGTRRKYSDLKAKEAMYAGEFEKATWRAGEVATGDRQGFNVKTHKATDEEFNSKYKVGVGAGGSLVGADGRLLDSESALSGRGEEGLLTYAMNPDGTFGAADGLGETRALSKEHGDWNQLPEDQRGQRPDRTYFHHSSFFGDDEVAAAGEMKVRNGTLKQIDNNTGHFKTRDAQTVQALDELKGRGANIDHANVRLLDHENVDQDTGRATSTQVPASAFMASGGNAKAHWAKAGMNAELLALSKRTKKNDKGIFKGEAADAEKELSSLLLATDGLSDEARQAAVKERAKELGVIPEDIDLYFDEVDIAKGRGGSAQKTEERAALDKRAKEGVDQRPIAPRMLAHMAKGRRDQNTSKRAAEQHPETTPLATSGSAYSMLPSSYLTQDAGDTNTSYSTFGDVSSGSQYSVIDTPAPRPSAPKSSGSLFGNKSKTPKATVAPLGPEENYGFADFVVRSFKEDGMWPPPQDANGTPIGQVAEPEPEPTLAPLGPEDNYGFADFLIPVFKAEGEWPPTHDVNGTPVT